MTTSSQKKPHVLFLFSDTGGGHRSAAAAIIEAMQLDYGSAFSAEMVDFLQDFGPGIWKLAPQLYPELVKAPGLWGASFRATNGRSQARVMTASMWTMMSRSMKKLFAAHPAQVVVSVHPLANSVALRALGRNRPAFFTVVTDMVSTHALWFDQRADKIIVPTELARERAAQNSIAPEKIEVVGLPVSERYCAPVGDKRALREKLGWPQGKTMVLLVGGGDGMGPLARTAQAIDSSGLDVGLSVVCGRNSKLEASLRAESWENPAFIYGFTKDLPDLMRAADFMITKAGPGTIAEAMNASLPIILYSKIPGQEDGNVTFVEDAGAGVWAPTPQQVVRTLTRWISRPLERARIAENAMRASRPYAAHVIAKRIAEALNLKHSLRQPGRSSSNFA